MPKAAVGEIEIVYEVLDAVREDPVTGPDARPILLVQGLGGQLTSWDDDFCAELTGRGFPVVRFDNRDVGLSTWFDEAGVPDLGRALAGDASAAPYGIEDMAGDAAGLLDALDIDAAHVVGVSMGGMIAQALAIGHPAKVASLCSIMSTTGDRAVGSPTPEALSAVMTPPPQDRAAAIEQGVTAWKVFWGSGFPFEEERISERIGRLYDRGENPLGVARQLAAIASAADRTEGLGSVTAPTLVVHGEDDPLVTPSGGKATHEAVPGSTFVSIPGMGHCLPVPVWSQVCDAIAANAATASRSGRPAPASRSGRPAPASRSGRPAPASRSGRPATAGT